MMVFSGRYDEALILAAEAHRLQVRKGTSIPYIIHPVHVSLMLIRCGFSEDVAVAALLHDVVEDCDVSLAEIADRFGSEVAAMVDALSEQKTGDDRALSWETRKRLALDHLRTAGFEVAAIKAADTLHNARSVARDLRDLGDAVWTRFRRGPVETLWYYRAVLAITTSKLGEDHPLIGELAAAIAAVARLAGEATAEIVEPSC